MLKTIRNILYRYTRANGLLDSQLNARLMREYQNGGIKVIYDIGAHMGNWAKETQVLMPDARMILFEANPAHAEALERTGLEFHLGILSRPGVTEVEFYVPEDGSASTGGSYFKEVTPAFAGVRGMKAKSSTLEDVVRTKNLPQPDFIKIDCQGSELDIIEGGESIFSKAKWILIEMPVVEYNSGLPGFEVYLKRVAELGFLPVQFGEVHQYGPVMVQLDFLFANRSMIDSAAGLAACAFN